MLVAVQYDDGMSAGILDFAAMPRLGEHLMLGEDRAEVTMVEHWPSYPVGEDIPPGPRVRIYCKALP